MDISAVIPALNEAENLSKLLPLMHQVLSGLVAEHEIIIVDNHSRDATEVVCAAGDALLVQQTEPGYGGALLAGFQRAKGEYILTMDADLSHIPSFIPGMWARRDDAEVVIASRYIEGGSADMPWYRYWLSVILNTVYRSVLDLRVRDISSGFRLYHASVLAGLDLRSNDFDVLQEILIKSYAEGYRIIEVPLDYVPRDSGKSKAKLIGFGRSYLRTLLRAWKLRNSVASADYDARAFDSIIPLQRYWQRTRHKIILGMTDPSKPCLDLGCGSSRILGDLPPVTVGMDVQINKLRYARRYGRTLVNGSIFALPFPTASQDQVVCSQVIEHLIAGDQPFREMRRVLKPGGHLILGTPDYGTLAWRVTEHLYRLAAPGGYADEHITRYTHAGLRSMLEEMGFRHLQTRYVGRAEMILLLQKTEQQGS